MPDTPATSLLTLDIERTDESAVVRCHGKLVFGVTDFFYTKINQLIPGRKQIVLDLSDLAYMDSMGIGSLVRLYVSARNAGCKLELTNLGKRVRELLGLTHLLSVFTSVGEHGTMVRF